jgi:hypothetical protein
MDISRALAYITDHDDWLQKLLIGGLLSLIPIVGQIWALGYATVVLKNIIEGRESPLPELIEDFGEKLIQGLLVSIMMIVYFLPLILVATVMGIGIGVVTAGAADQDIAGILAAIMGSCLGLLVLALGIIAGLFVPYAWSRYAESGQFGEAFKLNPIFEMLKANIGQTLLTLLVVIVLGVIANSVGSAICGIGVAFTGFYSQLVTSFLYGKLYLQAQAKTQ